MGYGTSKEGVVRLDKELVQQHYNVAFASAVLRCVLLVLAITGNSLVIATFWYFKNLHVTANLFLVNLAAANLFTGLFNQTSYTASIFLAFAGGDARPCTVHFRFALDLFGMAAVTVSFCSLFLVTLDRYIAVTYSLRYATFVTEKRTMFCVTFCWLFSVVLSSCRSFWVSSRSFFTYFWVLCLLVVTMIMAVIDLKLLCISKSQTLRIANQTKIVNPSAHCKKEMRGLATAAFVTAALLFCYVPHIYVEILSRTSNVLADTSTRSLVYQATLSLYLSNASINPYLYFLRSKRLRRYSFKLVKKFRRG
jgi:hypothetical protein